MRKSKRSFYDAEVLNKKVEFMHDYYSHFYKYATDVDSIFSSDEKIKSGANELARMCKVVKRSCSPGDDDKVWAKADEIQTQLEEVRREWRRSGL